MFSIMLHFSFLNCSQTLLFPLLGVLTPAFLSVSAFLATFFVPFRSFLISLAFLIEPILDTLFSFLLIVTLFFNSLFLAFFCFVDQFLSKPFFLLWIVSFW